MLMFSNLSLLPAPAQARSPVNKLLFRAMTSPPSPAIVDDVDNHMTTMMRSMCLGSKFTWRSSCMHKERRDGTLPEGPF